MLGEEEKSPPVQSHECGNSGNDDEVAGIADELERRRRLEVAVKGERTGPSFCFSFVELAVRLTKRSGTHEL